MDTTKRRPSVKCNADCQANRSYKRTIVNEIYDILLSGAVMNNVLDLLAYN